jgi:hypothetical protein
MLFAVQEPKIKTDVNSLQYLSSAVYMLSYKPRGKELLKGNDVIRSLLVKYIADANQSTIYNNLYLVANLELKEGVDVAKEMLKDGKRDPHTRGMALAVLGKVGGKATIPDILPYLQDKTSMGKTQLGNGNTFETEMRDVALATLVQMTNQNAHEYEFAYLKLFGGGQPIRGFNVWSSPTLWGFNDDKTRDKAFKKWDEWHAKYKDTLK